MLTLIRHSTSNRGTFGVFTIADVPICHSLELPWRSNNRNVSSIPSGNYRCVQTTSPKFGKVLYLQDVPNREGILIHAGNGLSDTRGCILVGLDVVDTGLAHSRLALSRLLASLPDTFTLKIKENY